MRTNNIPSAIRIIGHPFCFLREIPIATNNIPSSIDAIIAKNPILFTPFKMYYSIMTIGYFQIMSYSNDGGVKLFVHVKKQGNNSFSILHIQGRRRFISQNNLRLHDDSSGKYSSGLFSAGTFKRFLF